MTEINSCPYCGGEALAGGFNRAGEGHTQVCCMLCDARGPEHVIKTKAISLWNMMEVKQYGEGE